MGILSKIYNNFSDDIGIDLGTANTLVYVQEHGIIIDEPSVVALNKKSGRIVAVGEQAKTMLGKNPDHIEVVRPLVDGVISDYEVTEEMLHYLLEKAKRLTGSKSLFGPRVVVGVPSGITNVEARAVIDASRSAGAREVFIVEEPMAAAISAGMPVLEPTGSMVIDIGGGTTDVALISLGGIVMSRNIKVAGDHLNQEIVAYIRSQFKIVIGERTAEEVKIGLSSALPHEKLEMIVRGRDLLTGLPRQIIVTDADIREALRPALEVFIDGAKEVLESAPPEIVSDIMKRGVYLSGGGSLIRKLDELLSQELNLDVHIVKEPLSAVAKGAGMILEDLDAYYSVLIKEDDPIVA